MGRRGAREYFGYVLRDGGDIEEVFPGKYEKDVKVKNLKPAEYLEKFRTVKKNGGYTYQTGGEIINPYANQNNNQISIDPFQADTVVSDNVMPSFTSSSDVPTEGGSNLGNMMAYGTAAADSIFSFSEGVKGTKDFFKNTDDSIDFNISEARNEFKDARANKYEGAGNAVGFGAATALGAPPQLAAVAGKLVGKVSGAASKLFGTSNKVENELEKEKAESMEFNQEEERKAVFAARKKDEAKNISNYISEINPTAAMAMAELGGMLYGPSHAQGGIPIEVEGGEFIINKSSLKDNKTYTITGTKKKIASNINSDNGVNPYPGARRKNIYNG